MKTALGLPMIAKLREGLFASRPMTIYALFLLLLSLPLLTSFGLRVFSLARPPGIAPIDTSPSATERVTATMSTEPSGLT